MERRVVAAARDVLAETHDVGLPPEDLAGAGRFRRAEDRDAWVAARVLARRLVAGHLAVAPRDVRFVQRCDRCGGPHGRPHVVGHDVHVSWSHSGGLVAVIVDRRPCAIDVESLSLLGVPPAEALTDYEHAWLERRPDRTRSFAELWVRKEVLVKLGLVDLDDALEVDVTPSFSGRPVLGVSLRSLDTGPHGAVAAWSRRTALGVSPSA